MLRIFVSEYVCSGACQELTTDCSLAIEGRTMLLAAMQDFARLTGCSCVTTWDMRLGQFPYNDFEVHPVKSARDELALFRGLSADCDATLVISPEFDGLLCARQCLVADSGGRCLGSSQTAVRLCSDKLKTSTHLQQCGIPTPDTRGFDVHARELEFDLPLILKPRDGAGAQDICLVTEATEFNNQLSQLLSRSSAARWIQQPFIPGLPVSLAVLISDDREHCQFLPIGEQRFSDDGRFNYLGGRIPARLSHSVAQKIECQARAVIQSIEGLTGYVGIDLIVPSKVSETPVVLEINPRLTTAYLGYRELADENLLHRLICSDTNTNPIRWTDRNVEFSVDGSVSIV